MPKVVTKVRYIVCVLDKNFEINTEDGILITFEENIRATSIQSSTKCFGHPVSLYTKETGMANNKITKTTVNF